MDIKTFKLVAPSLPADIALLMRGPTGVGKSHLAAAIAKELKLPFIDVRGSTMSEGEANGSPASECVNAEKFGDTNDWPAMGVQCSAYFLCNVVRRG